MTGFFGEASARLPLYALAGRLGSPKIGRYQRVTVGASDAMKKKNGPITPRVPAEGVKHLRRHLIVPIRRRKKIDEIIRREMKKPS